MKNFWNILKHKKKFIYALAPMAGYTDSAFRQICKGFGAEIVYSEMASATALVYNPQKTLEMLEFSEIERPYVVQLFGSEPGHFEGAVKLLTKKPPSGFKSHSVAISIPDGFDINFGCPVKKVAKQGAGAVLMNKPKLAREIIKAVINSTDLPVSIKTRTKVGEVDVLQFLDQINDLDIKAVMIHGRTLGQGFSGPIDWQVIKKARNDFNGIILANGGVGTTLTPNPSPARSSRERGTNVKDYVEWLLDKTKADGIGIARGALGRPWIFKAVRTGQSVERTARPIFKIALKQAKLVEKLKGEQGLIEMRKHLCWYVQGLPGAKKMREELVRVESIKDIENVFNENSRLSP
ncbi:MAG: tRNA-dihydrouridine synthase [Patescibacteria group bacterium]